MGSEVTSTGAEGAAQSQSTTQQGAQSVTPDNGGQQADGGNTGSTTTEQAKKPSINPDIENFVKKHNIQGFDPASIDEKTMPFINTIVERYNAYDKGAQEKFRQAAEQQKQLDEYRTRYEKEQQQYQQPNTQQEQVEELDPIATVDKTFTDKIGEMVKMFGVESDDALFSQYPELQRKLATEYQIARMDASANMAKYFFESKEKQIQEKQKAQEAEQRFAKIQDTVLSYVDERKRADPEFSNKLLSAGTDEIVGKISAMSKVPSSELLANRDFFNFIADVAMQKHELNDLKKNLPNIKAQAAKEHEERVTKSKMNEGVGSGGSTDSDPFWAAMQRHNKNR